MHLAVIVNRDDVDGRLRVSVACPERRSDVNEPRIASMDEQGPAEAVVVFGVQVGREIDIVRPARVMEGYHVADRSRAVRPTALSKGHRTP